MEKRKLSSWESMFYYNAKNQLNFIVFELLNFELSITVEDVIFVEILTKGLNFVYESTPTLQRHISEIIIQERDTVKIDYYWKNRSENNLFNIIGYQKRLTDSEDEISQKLQTIINSKSLDLSNSINFFVFTPPAPSQAESPNNNNNEYYLITAHSHSYLDGRGYMLFIEQLFEKMNELFLEYQNGNINVEMRNNEYPKKNIISDDEVITNLLNDIKTGVKTKQTPKYNFAEFLPADKHLSPSKRQISTLFRDFNYYSKLKEKCREKKTSVHSLIVSIISHSFSNLYNLKSNTNIGEEDKIFPLKLLINTPVDLRQFIHNENEPFEKICNLVTVPSIPIIVYSNLESFNQLSKESENIIWRSAIEYKTDLALCISSRDFINTQIRQIECLKDLSHSEFYTIATPVINFDEEDEEDEEDENCGRVSSLNISNLGELKYSMKEEIGVFKINKLYGGSGSRSWGDSLYVAIATSSHTTSISFVYCDIYYNDTISLIADSTISLLNHFAFTIM